MEYCDRNPFHAPRKDYGLRQIVASSNEKQAHPSGGGWPDNGGQQ